MKNLVLFTLCVSALGTIAAMENAEATASLTTKAIPQESDECSEELAALAALNLSGIPATSRSPRTHSCPEAYPATKKEAVLPTVKSTSPYHPTRTATPPVGYRNDRSHSAPEQK